MKVTTERQDNCQVNVFIELDAAEVEKKLRQTARKISRHFNVPGYRRGKAPYHAVLRVFGREAVQQEALDEFGQELYDQALEETEYKAYQPGELQEVEWDPFRMTVLVPLVPEVDLGDYRAARVAFEPEPITEERIEEYLAETQQEHAQWVPVDRAAVLGDQVVIDAEGKIGEVTVLSNEDYEMLLEAGATYPLPGFHEEIEGMKAGEDKTFTLTYPDDDFEENVAGKEATFTVHLHSVKEEEVPPLDDDLALMVGDYESLDELKESVRETLEANARREAESQYLDQVLEAMIEAAPKLEYPPQAIDREADVALAEMERNLSASGIQLDTYLQMMGKTRESYKSELGSAAEVRLKKRLVMVEVAQREGMKIEDDEIDAEVDRVSQLMGENADQMREFLQSPQGRQSLADDLMTTKLQERVTLIGKGEAPPLEDETIAEADAEDEADAGAEAEDEDGATVDVPAEDAPTEATEAAVSPQSEAAGAEANDEQAPVVADETPGEDAPEALGEPEPESTSEEAERDEAD